MPVIAIVNRKGGSGKSTLSTHIAVAWARAGQNVMLGDVDRQQSIRSWLRRRAAVDIPISTWVVDQGKMLRPPPGTSHVVLDTPGALYGLELAKVVMRLDALVVPVGPSIFDRDASMDFLAELRRLPRVASGHCQVAVVGMRWSQERTQRWFLTREWDLPLVTVLPDSTYYRTCLDQGRTLFDQPDAISHPDMRYWEPLLAWLDAVGQQRRRRMVTAAPSAENERLEVPALLRRRSGSDLLTARQSGENMGLLQRSLAGTPISPGEREQRSARLAEHPARVEPTVDEQAQTERVKKTVNGFWSSKWSRMFR